MAAKESRQPTIDIGSHPPGGLGSQPHGGAELQVPPIGLGSQSHGGADTMAPRIEVDGPGTDRNDSSVPLFLGETSGSFDIYLRLLRTEHDELRRECARLQAQVMDVKSNDIPGSASAPAATAGSGPDSGSQQDAIREEICLDADSGAREIPEDDKQEDEGILDSTRRGFQTLIHDLVGDTGASAFNRRKVSEIMQKQRTSRFGTSKSNGPGVFSFRGAKELKRKLKWVRDNRFSLVVSVVIIINAMYMAIQTSTVLQRTRQDTAYHMSESWIVGDAVFAAIFTSELVLRVFAYQVKFYNGTQKWWNLFDCVTLVATLVALGVDIAKAPSNFYVNFLKMLRLLRLVRSLKASKSQRLHVLKTLMYTVAGSANAFLSAILLLIILISVFGVMFMQGLQNYIQSPNYRQDTGRRLEQYFGTFSDASYTLVACITGGFDWEEVTVHLKEIGTLYHWFFVLYIMFAVLCVLNILNGVFVTAAIESAQSNKELAVESTYHKRMGLVKQMVRWFNEADKDGSGKVSWEELRDIMHDDEVRHMMLASGIDVTSAGQIFTLLDKDKSGDLEPGEFVDNLIALQGNAQALDMAALRMICEETSERVKEAEAAILSHLRNIPEGSDSPRFRSKTPRYSRPQQMASAASPSPRATASDDLSPGRHMTI